MTKLFGNLGAKEWFIMLVLILFITDITILLNIPFLRQILAFLCFTIIPGLLILYILKLNKIEFIKKFVLSVGLSVAFLIFAGLLVNSFYPLILKPLSLAPILISFTIILIILAFIAYKRNKDDFDIKDIINFKLDLKDKLASPLIFPIIFPFMAVFGTYLMNTQGNNIILMAMLFLIPAYIVAVVILRNKIPKATYPIAIWMIGMSLLLMHGLTSYHLVGRDIHGEYYCFRLAISDFHWDISKYYNAYNACLSVTILPPVYQTLLNINAEYIQKLIFGLIGSITPLGIYVISKRYISKEYAFFASLLFIFQLAFIYQFQSATRQEIAMLFFVLAIMIYFDRKMDNLSKTILFIIFMISVIVSHYTTAYIFFIVLLMLKFASLSKSFFGFERTNKPVSVTIIVLFSALIFSWYSQLTEVPFNNGVVFVDCTFSNLGEFFVEETRDQTTMKIFGVGITSTPTLISTVVHDTIFAFIGIGLIDLLVRHKSYRKKIDGDYLVCAAICFGLLLMLFLPFVSMGYGAPRIFSQSLVFLAPVFVIGGEAIVRGLRRPQLMSVILLILLILQLSAVTYMPHHFYGIPQSPDYEIEGENRDEYYIYDQELVVATWLSVHGSNNLKVYSDRAGYSRLMLGYDKVPNMNTHFFSDNITIDSGYIYLGYANVVKGTVRRIFSRVIREGEDREETKDINKYAHLFIGKSKIYSNGGSEVYG